jgi:hypothetical protein
MRYFGVQISIQTHRISACQKTQHPAICNIAPYICHQRAMGDGIEDFQISVNQVGVSCLEESICLPQGVFTSAFRPKSIAVRCKFLLEGGLDHQTQRRLYHAVPHTGNAKRPFLFCFRLCRCRRAVSPSSVAPCAKFFGKTFNFSREVPLKVPLFMERVDSRGSREP